MSLAAGTKLGPYEILAPLGAGGMGEVYRAKDSRLDREVAIKVLPEHLSMNPDMRARFEREAKTVSSLNHPHICTLHDVGHQDGVDYLVMELLDGETLAARLEKGALPVPEMLRVATQIADALDRAHRQGLVHRDLKPGNVMLTRGGAKLLDFGLARATGLAGPARGSGVTVAALTQSPTVASPLTAEGSLVGTFQYMSPEQLEGTEADARSDIFAFGATLYEMATGHRAFEAKSQASLIAAILEREPSPVSQAAPMCPPALDRVVQQCLAKDPEKRYQSAHDLRLQLEWIAEGGSQAGVPAPVAARRRSRFRMVAAVATIAIAVAAAFAIGYFGRAPVAPQPVRFLIPPPDGLTQMDTPCMSPDGRLVAWNATDSTGTERIWLRPIGSLEAYPLAGTEGAARPFWSPDGASLAFFAGGKLKRVPAAGGAVLTVCEFASGADGSWGSRNIILFDAGASDSIMMVPAAGGVPQPVTSLDRASGDTGHAWPYFLPDGRHYLFQAQSATLSQGTLCVGDTETGKVVRLVPIDSRAEFSPPDHVFIQRGVTLLAQRLDTRSFKLIGDPFPVVDGLSGVSGGRAFFSISHNGTIAYRPGGASGGGSTALRWFDRSGGAVGDEGQSADYTNVRLSPDGRRILYSVIDPGGGREDVWVRDLERGVSSKLTFDPSDETWPIWSADGARATYTSNQSGVFTIMEQDANGTGQADSLATLSGVNVAPMDWSLDGSTLLFARYVSSQWDILSFDRASGETREHVSTGFIEYRARLSPDGRWFAYRSNESGRNEIYVRPFPGPGGKWQVSTAGGSQPRWRRDGKEIIYLGPNGDIVAVPVSGGDAFSIGVPATLFSQPPAFLGFSADQYDVTADAQHFLFIVPTGQSSAPTTAVLMNWKAAQGR